MNNKTLTLKMKRAISELRSGGKVVISDNNFGTSILLMSAELIEKESVKKLSELALSRPNIILSSNRCNALQRLLDKIILGLDKASSDSFLTLSFSINSADISRMEVPKLLSDITTLPPLLSSDIALFIFNVRVLLFIIICF